MNLDSCELSEDPTLGDPDKKIEVDKAIEEATKVLEAPSNTVTEYTEPKEEESRGKVEYKHFNLPEDEEDYNNYVNNPSVSIKKDEVKLLDDGTLSLHLFAVIDQSSST